MKKSSRMRSTDKAAAPQNKRKAAKSTKVEDEGQSYTTDKYPGFIKGGSKLTAKRSKKA